MKSSKLVPSLLCLLYDINLGQTVRFIRACKEYSLKDLGVDWRRVAKYVVEKLTARNKMSLEGITAD
jgi:hypothetical protein